MATVLDSNVHDLTSLTSVQHDVTEALRGLRGAVDQELSQVRVVLLPGDVAPAPDSPLANAVKVAEAYRAALEADGVKASPLVRSTARSLAEWLLSSECEQVVREAEEQSSHHHLQWRRARRAAVDSFVDTWRRVRMQAMQASVWESATRRIADLRTALRDERAWVLSRLADAKVQTQMSASDWAESRSRARRRRWRSLTATESS